MIIYELITTSDDADTHIELSIIRLKSRVLLINPLKSMKTVILKTFA